MKKLRTKKMEMRMKHNGRNYKLSRWVVFTLDPRNPTLMPWQCATVTPVQIDTKWPHLQDGDWRVMDLNTSAALDKFPKWIILKLRKATKYEDGK